MKQIAFLLILFLFLPGCTAQSVLPDEQKAPDQTTELPHATSSAIKPANTIPATAAPFARIDFEDTVSADMDFDGTDESIRVSQSGDSIVTVAYTDKDVQKEDRIEPFNIEKCFIDDVVTGDKYLELFVIGDMASDDYVTYIYRLKDGAMDKCSIDGIVKEADGTGSLAVNVTINVFGTYGAKCTYTLKDGFSFAVSSPYTILPYEGFDSRITVKKDGLAVEVLTDGGQYENILLSAGTKLQLKETDCESYGLFTTEDAKTIRIAITKKPDVWGWYIAGLPEEEWFDNLNYAG